VRREADVRENDQRPTTVVTDEPPPATPDGDGQPPPAGDGQPGDSDEGGGDEPSDSGNGGGRRLSRFALWVGIVGGILGALVAALTLYLFVSPPSRCSGLSGTLDEASLDRDVTYGEFLRITNQEDPTADKETLARHGSVIAVTISAEGYEGKELPVRWTTFTRGGHLAEDELTDQLALGVVPEKCSDTIRRKLWARWPKKKDTYLVEVTLLDDRDSVLDTVRTSAFAVPKH
jgi:hypothetical protein